MVSNRLFLPTIQLTAIDGLAFRRLDAPSDYPAMNAIANASRIAEGNPFLTSDADFANFYSHLANCDPARDVLVADIGAQLVGYGRVGWHDERAGIRVYELICFLEPNWTRQGIGRSMLRSLEGRAQAIELELGRSGSAVFQAQATDTDLGRSKLLAGEGYQAVRYFYVMVRPNLDDQDDAPLPAGLEIRPVLESHLPSIWAAHVEAFADHWGAGQSNDAEYQEFLSDPTVNDAGLWRVAWDGDEVAGQVRSFINAEENRQYQRQRAWIEPISVRAPWRHRGLARALIAESIRAVRERGMSDAALHVDTANLSGALGIYESIGFRPVSRETVYRKELALTS